MVRMSRHGAHKKGAAFCCPFSEPLTLYLELIQALDQVWLGIVRPVVRLGAGCGITPSRLRLALPARSSTRKFSNRAGDAGINLSWKDSATNTTGGGATVRVNPSLGRRIWALSESAKTSQFLVATHNGDFTDDLTSR